MFALANPTSGVLNIHFKKDFLKTGISSRKNSMNNKGLVTKFCEEGKKMEYVFS